MLKIVIAKKALKELKKISQEDQKIIKEKVLFLKNGFNNLDVKRICNERKVFRLRVRNFRVIFNFLDHEKTIKIKHVRRRNEKTYR